ncbi:MAG: DUF2959 domain-containing protein [Gammaproteobacteria bacterium]
MSDSAADKNFILFSVSWLAKRSFSVLSKCISKRYRHAYYRTKESLGQHKRDIIVYRVEEACDNLQETREHFEDALERFKALTHFKGGTLEHRYYALKRQFELSQVKTQTVSEKIRAIEEVGEALFLEWESELNQYSNRTLRAYSRQQLKETHKHYERLMKAMYLAEAKIHPVLTAFRDQVLFLKHNLNAQAIAALRHELVEIGIDIATLIAAMEKSINEASRFVAVLAERKALPASEHEGSAL